MTVYFKNVIANLLSLVKSQCKLNKIKIESQYDYSIPRLKSDLGRLQQVFMILVSNAIWAMPEGGSLTLKDSSGVLPGFPVSRIIRTPGVGDEGSSPECKRNRNSGRRFSGTVIVSLAVRRCSFG